VVLGSGLGAFGNALKDAKHFRFSEIPHFPVSTVYGHGGQMVIGTSEGAPVAVMQGRVHAYEGIKASQVVFPLRMLRQLGVEKVILTNAAGGIREGLQQGDLVLISDHINLSGQNPLVGPNDERFGPRFVDMTEAYSPRLRAAAQEVAKAQGFAMKEGVYLSVLGPSFETPAEIRAFRTLGADLIGMSTVMETIAARHLGMEVLGISCVTNLAAGLQGAPLSHDEVLETGKRVEARMQGLLTALIPRMDGGSAA
jgi:purine-nucleoside phosphorylase